MRDIRVASRYAKSLVKLSLELGQFEQAKDDMALIQKVCEENKDFRIMLKSPLVKPDTKQNIIKEIFSSSISELTGKFLEIIISKKREELVEDIAIHFLSLYRINQNINRVYVTTAVPLTDAMKKDLPQMVIDILDKESTVELIEEVDKELIGGMVLRVGDLQLDDSIRKKLRNLEREFSSNPYIKQY